MRGSTESTDLNAKALQPHLTRVPAPTLLPRSEQCMPPNSVFASHFHTANQIPLESAPLPKRQLHVIRDIHRIMSSLAACLQAFADFIFSTKASAFIAVRIPSNMGSNINIWHNSYLPSVPSMRKDLIRPRKTTNISLQKQRILVS